MSGVQVANAPDNINPTVPAIPQREINEELIVSSVEMVAIGKATEAIFGAVATTVGSTAVRLETTVLGSTKGGYVEYAESIDANYFRMSEKSWNGLQTRLF